jgi:hypothetical protein
MTTSADTATAVGMSLNTPSLPGVLSRLAQKPYGSPPPGTYQDEREDGTPLPMTFGDVDTGDWIAIGGLWRRIVRSFQINDVVTVHTADQGPIVSGPWNAPVHLAHVCCVLPAKRCP